MIRTLLTATVLLTAGAFTNLTAQTPNYRIAFNTPEDSKADDYEVYSMNIDGTGRKNITKNKDVAWTYYAWKDRLFFVSDRGACRRCYHLYESDADGNNVRKVTGLQLEDSWMGARNNGRELIVAGRIDTRIRYQLFIVDTKTGQYRQLTNEPAAAFRDPTFSPDGKKIIYVYKKNRTDRSGDRGALHNERGRQQPTQIDDLSGQRSACKRSRLQGRPSALERKTQIHHLSVKSSWQTIDLRRHSGRQASVEINGQQIGRRLARLVTGWRMAGL